MRKHGGKDPNNLTRYQWILESCRSQRCTCSCTAPVLQNPRTGTLFRHRALLKNPPCAATRILAQYSSRIRARAGSLSTQRQISIPVLVLRTVPVQFTHVSAYRYRSVSCTRTAVGFTGDLQIQSRASLFSARSESNPVLILPLRNRIKTYLSLHYLT